jgi:secondary thiamine-phosphate synthase enzyme
MQRTLTFATTGREQLLDITQAVNKALADAGASEGFAHLWCPHTTAGLTVNEGADPDVAAALLSALRRIVPESGFRHAEGNSPAHVKAMLTGPWQQIAVKGGRLMLGRWQAVFLCEFDGPRDRSVQLSFIPASER